MRSQQEARWVVKASQELEDGRGGGSHTGPDRRP